MACPAADAAKDIVKPFERGAADRSGLGIRLAFTTWPSARFFAVTGHGAGDPTVDITALLDEFKKLEAKRRRYTLRVVAR